MNYDLYQNCLCKGTRQQEVTVIIYVQQEPNSTKIQSVEAETSAGMRIIKEGLGFGGQPHVGGEPKMEYF